MKTAWKLLGALVLLLVLAFSGAIGRLVGKASFESFNSSKTAASLDATLLKTASDLNSKLPVMVDSETRLDSTLGLNKTFRYNYTLVNHLSAELSAAQLDSTLGQKLLNNVCTSREMASFVDNGVAVSYAYFGNDGKQITVITVAPSQCAAARATPSQVASERRGSPAQPNYDSRGWTQESTKSAEAGPWLNYDPPGTRYCRMADGDIHRVFPPGIRPNSAPANAFCVGDSTPAPPK